MPDDLQPGEALGEAGDTAAPEPPPAIDLPGDPAEALPVALEALAEARQMLAARTDDLQRVAAEFENYRKRVQREREEEAARSAQRLVEALLPVLDTFDNALAHPPKTPGEEQLLAGMQSTRHQLMDVLARQGVEVIPAEGERFDPAVHEAVMGGGSGDLVVAAEMRRGYTMGGRVLRPAMVHVADEDQGED